MNDLTSEHIFDLQAMSIIVRVIFWHVVHVCLYNQALTDVRSSVAGIKCL